MVIRRLSKERGHHYFVTGTDTGVGKSYFCAWLTKQWCARGLAGVALKPISCGDRADGRLLQEASGKILTLDEVNPFHFRAPLAPWAAAQKEGQNISLRRINQAVAVVRPRFSHLLVEGVGGWRVPLTRRESVREWAQQLGLPVLVVARAGLGTLNHTLLTWESILQSGCRCAGIILNTHGTNRNAAVKTNPQVLAQLTGAPIFLFTRRNEERGGLPTWLE